MKIEISIEKDDESEMEDMKPEQMPPELKKKLMALMGAKKPSNGKSLKKMMEDASLEMDD